ncbi:MAG: hypothetical protein KGI67_12940, partial [Pseudomonadota bacterium]|nr:hypothetical protein [Pseudomonadota bacterium]
VRTGLPDVRPPRPAPLIDTGRVEQQLRGVTLAAALVAVWLLLVLAWQGLRPGRRTPFAAAQRDLRRLLRNATSLAGARAAVQRVHRAFDEAAGQRLFSAGVAAFCQRMGADATLEKRTESFFGVSQTLFFAVTGSGDAAPAAVPDGLARELAELCRAWRKFEGRHP